jgi:transposase
MIPLVAEAGGPMARRTFDVIDICEIFTHWHAGRSKNEIAGSLGLSRNTVRKYLAAAEAAGMAPGGPAVSQQQWAELARQSFPELPEEARRSQVTVLRLVPAEPGQEAQIDYGQLGRWLDPRTGRRHIVNAFAMVLCCSRHMFVRPVITMDQHAWTECHVAAFGFFGGVAARLVPDNLKTGVDRPDLYDPKINRSYAELAAHYGCLVDPARSEPRDKLRVAYCTSSGCGPPRVFRTAELKLFHAASCRFRYSSCASCGVR